MSISYVKPTGLSSAQYRIRTAKSVQADVDFIVAAFDSALPFLATVGGRGQWGETPFSQRPSWVDHVRYCVAESTKEDSTTTHEVFIAEREQGSDCVRCAATIIGYEVPDYIQENAEAMTAVQGVSKYVYLHMLIADQRLQPPCRGAGESLIRHVKEVAKQRGARAVFVDCYSGNNGVLVSYYKKHGFREVAHFSKEGKHEMGQLWTGMLLRYDP